MLHESAAPMGKDPAFPMKRRLGVQLLAVYALIYIVFIAINVANVNIMEIVLFAGLNLAVVYGFGLIILALCMALVYSSACTRLEDKMAAGGEA